MTYIPSIIFDQPVQGGQVYISQTFTNARFILIDTVDLPQEEAYELGFSVNLIVPIIGRTIRKNFALLPEELIGIFDTFYVIPLPPSIYESQYESECVISLSLNATVTTLRIYAYTSEFSPELTNEKLDSIIDSLDVITNRQVLDLAEDTAQVINSVQNNIAFGILATSLVPFTGGTSIAALPPIGIGSASLTGLLLPGI